MAKFAIQTGHRQLVGKHRTILPVCWSIVAASAAAANLAEITTFAYNSSEAAIVSLNVSSVQLATAHRMSAGLHQICRMAAYTSAQQQNTRKSTYTYLSWPSSLMHCCCCCCCVVGSGMNSFLRLVSLLSCWSIRTPSHTSSSTTLWGKIGSCRVTFVLAAHGAPSLMLTRSLSCCSRGLTLTDKMLCRDSCLTEGGSRRAGLPAPQWTMPIETKMALSKTS